MEFQFTSFKIPEESYSRQLDKKVARQEMPYGYTISPPPADTGDYDLRSKETNMQYRPKRRVK